MTTNNENVTCPDPALDVDPVNRTTQELCDQVKAYLTSLGYQDLYQFTCGDTGAEEIHHEMVGPIEDEDNRWHLSVSGKDWEDVGDFGPPGVLLMCQDDNCPNENFDSFDKDLMLPNLGQLPGLLKKYGWIQ